MMDHVHKFNATIITTQQNPVTRCSCGAWSTPRKNGVPLSPQVAKGLETRLGREMAGRPEPTAQPRVAERDKEPRYAEYNPDTTPEVDAVIERRRRP